MKTKHILGAATAALLFAGLGFGVTLKPGAPIVMSAAEPEPVRRAVRDLQRDLRQVLGAESPVVGTLEEARGRAALVVLGPGAGPAALRKAGLTGREEHAVFARGENVVLQGADARGTIYAIYTFSEHVLGVAPLTFWASWQPAARAEIEVPAEYELVFHSPYVRYRAWFPNDEDLLNPWRARSAENFEAFLETMLRLKMNTLEGGLMDPGAFREPYRIGRQAALARDRGLAVTGHHMLIFGSNYNHWKEFWTRVKGQEAPALTIANTAALEEFWRYHIEAGRRAGLEMLWLVGFRGDRDTPFWKTFPDAPATEEERGRVIQTMIERQVALLKKVTGEAAPTMRITLYDENSDLFAKGFLHFPDEPNLVRTFVAARRDHYPAPDLLSYRNEGQRPMGYYMNFQFTSSGAHLAQAEGPWKMERNFRTVNRISGRPLEFSVVNAGNVREFVMELELNARMMWDFEGFRAGAALESFCGTYFGRAQAGAAARLYREFYEAYWTPKRPDLADFERQYVFQDMRYARAMEDVLAALEKGRNENPLTDRGIDANGRYYRLSLEDNGATNQLEALQKATAAAAARFDRVAAAAEALAPKVAPQGQVFFRDNLVTQARWMAELNRALGAVARAMEAMPERGLAAERLKVAETALAAAAGVLQGAEHGRFAGWYAPDRLFGLSKLRASVERARAGLEGGGH